MLLCVLPGLAAGRGWDGSAWVSVHFGELTAGTARHGHGPHRSRVWGAPPGQGQVQAELKVCP